MMDDLIRKHARHVAAGGTSAFTRDDFYKALGRGAAEIRAASETAEQAFARFATEFEDGRALLAAHKRAPAPRIEVTSKAAVAIETSTPEIEKLNAMVRSKLAQEPTISIGKARRQVISTREGAALLREHERKGGKLPKDWLGEGDAGTRRGQFAGTPPHQRKVTAA